MTQPDARAERTEPATGDLAAFEDIALAVTGVVNTVRTEPATGEDEEQDAANVEHILSTWWVSDGHQPPEQVARRILAALDLPGRERALREEIERLERAFRGAMNSWGTEVANVTSALDDLKFANEQIQVARDNTAALLEEARGEVLAWKERAGHLELENARLIEAYDRARAEVAEEIAQHLITAGNDVNQNLAWMYPNQAAAIARQHAGGEGGAT